MVSCRVFQRALRCAGAIAFALGASTASAQSTPEKSDSDISFSTNAALATDYRFRGFTQTREGFAVQGGVEMTHRWLYAGAWASNVDFGKVVDRMGRLQQTADFQVDVSTGIRPKIGNFQFDVGLSYYAYPGAYGVPENLDYFEFKNEVKFPLPHDLSATLGVRFSPDYSGQTGRNWGFDTNLKRTFGEYGSLKPALSAGLSYNAGTESRGGIDYWFWNAGGSVIVADYFELDLRYWDTIDVPSHIDCTNRCDGRFVARIVFEN